MVNSTIHTRALKYIPTPTIFEEQWILEDTHTGQYKFSYDANKKKLEIANDVADFVKNKLKTDYKPMGYDPYPQAALIYGGAFGFEYVGADVYYHGLNGTMKISARMRIKRERTW